MKYILLLLLLITLTGCGSKSTKSNAKKIDKIEDKIGNAKSEYEIRSVNNNAIIICYYPCLQCGAISSTMYRIIKKANLYQSGNYTGRRWFY